jgi:hypothetical protein
VKSLEKSLEGSSKHSESQLAEAEENLVHCLDGLDNGGEKGLQEDLERIYPEPDDGAVRINLMTSSPAIGFPAFTPKTVPYRKISTGRTSSPRPIRRSDTLTHKAAPRRRVGRSQSDRMIKPSGHGSLAGFWAAPPPKKAEASGGKPISKK